MIFYQRLGFKVADESMCPVGEGYTSWTMVREPVLRQEEEEEGEEGERAQLDLAMLWRGVRISRRWMVDAAQGRPGFGSAVLSSGRHVRGARHAVCDVHDTFEFDSFGRGAGGSCLHQSMAMTWQRHDDRCDTGQGARAKAVGYSVLRSPYSVRLSVYTLHRSA